MTTRRLVLQLGALGAALAAAGCADAVGKAVADDGQLRLSMAQPPRSFDPAQAQLGHFLPFFQAVYDPVLRIDADGTVGPNLATAWEYDEARTRLTLTLRTDVVFTDGATFDSQVLKQNVEAFLAGNGPYASVMRAVTGVETPAPDTAVIVLSAPDPGFLETLGSAGGFIASPQVLGSPTLAMTPVGSGPYVLDAARSTTGVRYTFTRNPDWWGGQMPYDGIVMDIMTDNRARLNALKAGQLAGGFISNASDAVEGESAGLVLEQSQVNFEGLIMFDRLGTLNPALADVRVRRALSVAVNRKGILEGVLLGRGEVTGQIFRPGDDGYLPEYDDAFPYDPDEARGLLADAGYTDLEVDFPVSSGYDPAIIDSVIANWSSVGVRARRQEWASQELIPNLQKAEASVAYFSLAMQGTWRQMANFIAEKASWNPFKVGDPVVADRIDRYQRGDVGAAEELNTFLVENVWFAPFYRPNTFYLHARSVDVSPQSRQAVPAVYNFAPAD
ncbi:ABC transporter substrate-binding protein [Kineococcus sp. LSe6-4]|uniref:ABC transporter substrate-binding protein n=1 Tax=Kineococcus halophytocola TaxID=3234027 RepID=A0ABV4H0M8_9ACTN